MNTKKLPKTLYIIYMMINVYNIRNSNLLLNEKQDINQNQQEITMTKNTLFNINILIISVILILILVMGLYFRPKDPKREELKIFFKNSDLYKYNDIIPYLAYTITENIDLNLFEYPRLYVYSLIQRACNINKTEKINIDKDNSYMNQAKEIYEIFINNITNKIQQELKEKKIYTNINIYINILLGSYLSCDSLPNLLTLLKSFDANNTLSTEDNLFIAQSLFKCDILQKDNYKIEVVFPLDEDDSMDLKFFGNVNGIRKWYTIKIVPLE